MVLYVCSKKVLDKVKIWKIIKVITINPKRDLDVCTKFRGDHGYPVDWDISLKTPKVNLMVALL